jgi:hypothetical protein
MVLAYIKDVVREDGPAHQIMFRVRYYVEEACGRAGCDDHCMGFDNTGDVFVTLAFDQMRSQPAFNQAMKDAILAHVVEHHPFKHKIPAEDIILCPTSF